MIGYVDQIGREIGGVVFMVSCCSIDPYTEFEVIIIGAGVPEVSLAFHLTSYGIRTALADEQNVDNRLKGLFKNFSRID